METNQNITDSHQTGEPEDLNELLIEALVGLNDMAEQPTQIIADFALRKAIRLARSKSGYFAFLNHDETVATIYSFLNSADERLDLQVAPQEHDSRERGRCAEAVRRRRHVIVDKEIPVLSFDEKPLRALSLH